ncbi:tRNA glutamyl-Q(34) synthetase GluQRS [uncultured Erythrobacter sp.]|uniref:tRNA glutamyl-Q(34) synthetase GluQRS n=1 Tax=uncultured Erythrobacter sp. TaxID=263913 RepID=UPI0026105773|nr:tRNA glutamyl-Q(34) synthetase GluQRS [uncultured Erythrobacter sp.]
MSDLPPITRFAPSPNGPLHLGHAYSAIVAHDLAREAGGRFLLRIEDIDGPRSKPEFADEFRRDLEWLGLEWDEVPAQSTRLDHYAAAAEELLERGLAYLCCLTRKELSGLPPRRGADGLKYPASSRGQFAGEGMEGAALRLDIDRAMEEVGELLWIDDIAGEIKADPRPFGDVVLVRKDLPASYHLAVTLDDARDGVTLVTRGLDLFAASHIHRVLQALLDLPVPRWHHHRLLLDENGEKLAKRKGSPSLSDRRRMGEEGAVLAEQLRLQNFTLGT